MTVNSTVSRNRSVALEKLRDTIAAGGTVLLDGAMGSTLIDAGLELGTAPEEWNVTHPDVIEAIHRGYIEAGSKVVLTNTFGGNRPRLGMHDLEDRVDELNKAAVDRVRAAIGDRDDVVVAGSMSSTGDLLEPLGDLTEEAAREIYGEQAKALAEGGVDIIWIETMWDPVEIRAAVEGVRAVCDLPIAVTLSFETRGHTMMGVSPAAAAEALRDLDLFAIGANCGTGPGDAEAAVAGMREVLPDAILIGKPNAGVPVEKDGVVSYTKDPADMAEYAERVRDLGAGLIGACCGSTADHLQAMAEALAEARPEPD